MAKREPLYLEGCWTKVFWAKDPGDYVEEGEIIASFGERKGILFIPAPVSGTLVDLAVPSGGNADVEKPIGYILVDENSVDTPSQRLTKIN